MENFPKDWGTILETRNILTVIPMEVDSPVSWRELADKTWLKPSTRVRKVRAEVVKQDLWDVLEKEEFDFRSLVELDNLQLLEKCAK